MTSAIVGGVNLEAAHALGELGAVAGDIESVFLEAGNRLGDAVGCWRAISETFTALAGQFERDDIRRCVDVLGAALQVAMALGKSGGGDALARLAELGSELAAMRGRLERLGRTIAEVKLVALNAKVEAAHLDEGSTDFSVFTREIDRLAQDAAGELSMLDKELRALAAEAGEAHHAQVAFAESHGAELLTVTRRLDEGLRNLSHQRHQVAEAATSIGDRSRLAGDRVGQAVLALQIGDITRQRTEHVVEALTVVTGLDGDTLGLAAADVTQATALVASLQARQLDQSAADLETEVGQVARSLAALAEETQAIGRLGRESFGCGENAFLVGFASEIGNVERLLEDYASAFSRTGEIMAAVASASTAMVAHVEALHSIEADLKIMALNASFKCSRLGDRGRTLSVVAQSLRQLANRTVEDAGVLMTGLQAALDTAHMLAHGTEAGDGDAISQAVGRLREASELLAAIGAEQAAALHMLETDSRRAQDLLGGSASAIAASDGFARRLRAVAGGLAGSADGIPTDDARAHELKEKVLSRLAGNYTMASERALHDLFGGDDRGQPAAETAELDVDDLLF
ncbi:MAG: hypothetical protein ACM3Q1_18525 [Bacteroidales bacterium]